jgi:deoxyhypusine synthase
MMARVLHDGKEDGLTPLEAIDPYDIVNFSGLLSAMSKTAFGGRQVGEAFAILTEMMIDPECLVVCTLSGAMTVAKQGVLLATLIDRGFINIIISTGALVTHGLTENVGLTHYKVPPGVSDEECYTKGYNRIYDTLEQESNLNTLAENVVWKALDELAERSPDGPWSSEMVTYQIGSLLVKHTNGIGILKSAYVKDVPVYIPAFTDSELGLDVSFWAMRRAGLDTDSAGGHFAVYPPFNPYLDLNSYAKKIVPTKKLGILTIGGGVPRNWAQQVSPYVDFMAEKLGFVQRIPKFNYGVKICTDTPFAGGMSGCTYSEGKSWGKFTTNAKTAEVYADATMVLPLLVMGLLEI